ncbi:MAG: hypothetical protein KAW12_16035, partial [Candidatus Aminicenantes bacterium]|nr:hypothetical protein [Candidatus Aminicenantes bacterium]
MTKYIASIIITCLALSSSLSPEKLTVLPELINPTMMDISGSELYILDDVQVLVYSLQDYRLLRKFGKKGEGPGELTNLPDAPFTMVVDKKKMLLNSVYKMIVYEKSGELKKEKKFPLFLIEAEPIGKNYVLTKFSRKKDGSSTTSTWICNPEFEEVRKIYERNPPNDYGKGKIAIPPLGTFARCADDRIFLFDRQKDFVIKVFDLKGNPLPDIKVPYGEIKTSDSYKKKIEDVLKLHPSFKSARPMFKKMIYIPEVMPVFQDCRVKDGRLYVQTYREKGDLSEFYILDFSGKVLKKI